MKSDSSADTAKNKEWKKRFRNKYPTTANVISSFWNNPLSGETVKSVLGKNEGETDDVLIQSVPQPSMWQETSQIVISQFVNYRSTKFTQYWTTTVPRLQEQYQNSVRYEHYDVPTLDKRSLDYKVATLGRALKYYENDRIFWQWFNSIIVDGVENMEQAFEIADSMRRTVEMQTLREVVEEDALKFVFEDDVNDLFGRFPEEEHTNLDEHIRSGEPTFILFINGNQVQASLDVIVGVIEELI